MGHPNEDLVRKGYAAFAAGDVATMSELFADDVVWHTAGRSSVSGTYSGKDEVFGFFGKLAEQTGGTFKLDLHDVIGNDEHVVVLSTSHAEKDGKTLDANVINVFHVKDGKTTEVWGSAEDQYAVDEFWG